MTKLQWFRVYHRMIDDEKIRLIAFEDRWHFIAVCCLKADGLLDEPDSAMKWRKIAVKMGVQARDLDEIKRRLFEVGLVDEAMQPLAWDDLQYRSDTSTERVRKYREKSKVTRDETRRNVSVTVQETETDTESESDLSSLRSDRDRETTAVARVDQAAPNLFEQFWSIYPHKVGKRDAEKAFATALKRASIADIMNGLLRYAAKTDDRPWCNPSTFLNQDRWTDMPAAAVSRHQSPKKHTQGNVWLDEARERGLIPNEHTGQTIDLSANSVEGRTGEGPGTSQFLAFPDR